MRGLPAVVAAACEEGDQGVFGQVPGPRESGEDQRDGWSLVRSVRACARISFACFASGTVWSRFIFMRAAGMIQSSLDLAPRREPHLTDTRRGQQHEVTRELGRASAGTSRSALSSAGNSFSGTVTRFVTMGGRSTPRASVAAGSDVARPVAIA